MDKIKELWGKNRDEIIDSVINIKQIEMQGKETEIEEKMERERKTIKLQLTIGIVYVLAGVILFRHLEQENLFTVEKQYTAVSFELLLLGIYALLYVSIFYSVYAKWENDLLLKIIKEFLIILMMPYHICNKSVKSIIRNKRQEHVSYLFPCYLISLLIIMVTYIFMIKFVAGWEIAEIFNKTIGFIIAFILIKEFFLCGKIFAYLSTKSAVKSVQKTEAKRVTKINWRGVVNRQKGREKFLYEWNIVEKELECTEIYFYIFLTLLVLCIPNDPGSVGELLSNQFLGITTISALAREAKEKAI